MRVAIAAAVSVLFLAGCNQQTASTEAGGGGGPQLDAPAPETEASRVFAPANDAATAATGQLNIALTLRLGDATQANADAQEVLTLTGANGAIVEATITGAVSPATQVQGQTLRALLALPVEEAQVLIYRVTNETQANGRGICGAEAATHIVLWEPSTPGDATLKLLGVMGGAPGAADSRSCPMLEYRRS